MQGILNFNFSAQSVQKKVNFVYSRKTNTIMNNIVMEVYFFLFIISVLNYYKYTIHIIIKYTRHN